jgi:hypothetical protein
MLPDVAAIYRERSPSGNTVPINFEEPHERLRPDRIPQDPGSLIAAHAIVGQRIAMRALNALNSAVAG